jgi:hypothetical protein
MLFAKENGSEYIIDYIDDKTESYWFSDDDYNEWTEDFVVHIRYGFLLMPKDYKSKDVVVKDCGNLYIGGKLVYDYITTCERLSEMKNRIPAYFCVRTEQESYTKGQTFLSFECGFDLQLTQFWANGNYFDTIEECFLFLQSKYGDFVITLEESMRMD